MSTAAHSQPVATSERTPWESATVAMVAAVVLVKLALHLATTSRYGYFRDELYYIACSRHLDWGYVDQPPLIAVVTWLELHLGGPSLLSLRFLPAIAGAVLIVLTAFMAREMGGKRFATAFAAFTTACVGIYFVMNYLLTMNAFEPLFWMGCAYVLVRIINTGNQKLWLWFGVLAGIGLQNKYSMAIFGFGIVVGLLLMRERKAFAQRWIWIAGVVAFLIFLPNLIWNVQHHWPFIELMQNIRRSGRDVALSPLSYIGQQIFILNPILSPVWLIGLLYLFFGRNGRRYRALGWAYLVTLVINIMLHGKNYYVAPAYPMLLAGGAVAIEGFIERTRQTWLKPAMVVVILVAAILFLPLGIPVLSAEGFLHYESKLPFALPVSEHGHAGAAMPQYYSDQFGWEEMTAAVARVWNSLTPQDRARTCIGASNYGEAGAIDFFGGKYGLPKAISVHQNYYLWGPRDCTGEIAIMLGDRPQDVEGRFAQVQVAAELYHPYAIRFENRPVLLCRGLKGNLRELWPKLKKWD